MKRKATKVSIKNFQQDSGKLSTILAPPKGPAGSEDASSQEGWRSWSRRACSPWRNRSFQCGEKQREERVNGLEVIRWVIMWAFAWGQCQNFKLCWDYCLGRDGERYYVFTSQESHFMSPEQPPVHLANLRIVLFSVLTIELENFEAQMLSGSGKVHGLLYSA